MYKILLVDDFKPNLRILELSLAEAGFRSSSAQSLEEAKVYLQRESFDLVLSDIQMPGGGGFELLSWIQEQGLSEVPVLLITSALPEAEHRVRGLSLGAVDYVLRSLSSDEIILRVQKAIEHVREIKRLKASLEDSEKLAALGRVIAASHHEIKNLVQIIRLSAGIVSQRSQTEEDKILLNAAKMLAELTGSMNALLKDRDAPSEVIDLSELIAEMVFMSKPVLNGIAVSCTFPASERHWVKASPIALKQVLLNLFLNARDAIDEAQSPGGLITIAVTEEGDSALRLEVRDAGVGLPTPSVLTQFPAFRSTKSLRGGTGLGLWLSARLLKGMGARLELASDGPGQGARASVWLEREKAPPPPLDLSAYLDADDES